jgi:hypothetical protein
MTQEQILAACKVALRVTTNSYDDEITGYIKAAESDLRIAGVVYDSVDELVCKAIVTYVRFSFGQPKDYDRLKASYDEQKAQMQMATGYTDWGAD